MPSTRSQTRYSPFRPGAVGLSALPRIGSFLPFGGLGRLNTNKVMKAKLAETVGTVERLYGTAEFGANEYRDGRPMTGKQAIDLLRIQVNDRDDFTPDEYGNGWSFADRMRTLSATIGEDELKAKWAEGNLGLPYEDAVEDDDMIEEDVDDDPEIGPAVVLLRTLFRAAKNAALDTMQAGLDAGGSLPRALRGYHRPPADEYPGILRSLFHTWIHGDGIEDEGGYWLYFVEIKGIRVDLRPVIKITWTANGQTDVLTKCDGGRNHLAAVDGMIRGECPHKFCDTSDNYSCPKCSNMRTCAVCARTGCWCCFGGCAFQGCTTDLCLTESVQARNHRGPAIGCSYYLEPPPPDDDDGDDYWRWEEQLREIPQYCAAHKTAAMVPCHAQIIWG